MKMKDALTVNPYNPKQGNKSAYARYLRYNVDGLYEKSNAEVRELWRKELEEQDHEQIQPKNNYDMRNTIFSI